MRPFWVAMKRAPRPGVDDPGFLPLFAPAFFDLWQVIIPRSQLVAYLPEREK